MKFFTGEEIDTSPVSEGFDKGFFKWLYSDKDCPEWTAGIQTNDYEKL